MFAFKVKLNYLIKNMTNKQNYILTKIMENITNKQNYLK